MSRRVASEKNTKKSNETCKNTKTYKSLELKWSTLKKKAKKDILSNNKDHKDKHKKIDTMYAYMISKSKNSPGKSHNNAIFNEMYVSILRKEMRAYNSDHANKAKNNKLSMESEKNRLWMINRAHITAQKKIYTPFIRIRKKILGKLSSDERSIETCAFKYNLQNPTFAAPFDA
jgi:hypothetical protein